MYTEKVTRHKIWRYWLKKINNCSKKKQACTPILF